jgi:hypothetical protein
MLESEIGGLSLYGFEAADRSFQLFINGEGRIDAL